MEVGKCVPVPIPELDRSFVKEALRSIALLKHVENKFTSEARQILPSLARGLSRLSPRPTPENHSGTAYPSSAISRTDALDRQAQRIQNRHMQLEREVQRHVLRHGEHSCRTLLNHMHQKLPRELRDIVYSFIAGDAAAEVYEIQVNGRPVVLPSGENQHTPTIQCQGFRVALRARGYNHLLNDGFVSVEVMRELAGTWYSLATHRLHNPKLIEKFLQYDVYGFKLSPRTLVKKMEVVHHFRDDASKSHNQLCTGLTHLLDLEVGAKVQLTLRTSQPHSSFPDKFRTMRIEKLAVLFPVITQLVKKDLQVTMVFACIFSFKVKLDELTMEDWTQKFADFEQALQARQALTAGRHLNARS